jgi:hypothetical protein
VHWDWPELEDVLDEEPVRGPTLSISEQLREVGVGTFVGASWITLTISERIASRYGSSMKSSCSSVTPRAKMASFCGASPDASPPSHESSRHSRAWYAGLPTTITALTNEWPIPKSARIARPVPSSRILHGLMSWCT